MDIQEYIGEILGFLNGQVIPILISIAFVFFLWNITRYFIIESANEESRERARGLAIWGLLALSLIVAIWGVVAVFVEALGVGSGNMNRPNSDYVEYRDENTYDTSDDTDWAPDPFNDNAEDDAGYDTRDDTDWAPDPFNDI